MGMKEYATSKLSPQFQGAQRPPQDRTGQARLFDDSKYQTPAPKPGNMSMDRWVETQDPVYHGTFREDWDKAPVAHMGTIGQAASRLETVEFSLQMGPSQRKSYYNPGSEEWETDEDGPAETEHVGRVYSRRLTERPSRRTFSDQVANAGEAGYRFENFEDEYEIPTSIKGSGGTDTPVFDYDPKTGNPKAVYQGRNAKDARVAHRMLERGRPLKYSNQFEGDNVYDTADTPHVGESFSVPSGASTSWERDVIAEPTASPMAQRYAQQRINQGQEGAVPFPRHRNLRAANREQQLFLPLAEDPNDHSDKLIKRDPNRDNAMAWRRFGALPVEQEPPPLMRSERRFTTKKDQTW